MDIDRELADLTPDELIKRAQETVIMESNQCGRVTVGSHFYHEQCGDEKTGESPSFSYLVKSKEQAWKRRIRLPAYCLDMGPSEQQWKRLDLGWLRDEGTSLIILSNKTSLRHLAKQASDEQKADLENQILLVRVDDVITQQVRPGRFTLFEPYGDQRIEIRSAAGELEINIFAMPK